MITEKTSFLTKLQIYTGDQELGIRLGGAVKMKTVKYPILSSSGISLYSESLSMLSIPFNPVRFCNKDD